MTQRELIEQPATTELVVAPPEAPPQQTAALTDFRQAFMSLPLDRMNQALAEYSERRHAFMQWLLGQMKRGIHYGTPPGCEPRSNPDPLQWTHKPSLYKAGADLICDLMGVRPTYEPDDGVWRQLGSKEGQVCIKCKLLSKLTEEVVGEGGGVFEVGEKKMGPNPTLKLAEKRAKVNAVLNSWGLSDLFTQDLEELDREPPPKHENPEHNRKAPKTDTRRNRKPVTKEDVFSLMGKFSERFAVDVKAEPEKFVAWVHQTTARQFNVRSSAEWTQQDVSSCVIALDLPPTEPGSSIPF